MGLVVFVVVTIGCLYSILAFDQVLRIEDVDEVEYKLFTSGARL